MLEDVLCRLNETCQGINQAKDNPEKMRKLETSWRLQDRLAFSDQVYHRPDGCLTELTLPGSALPNLSAAWPTHLVWQLAHSVQIKRTYQRPIRHLRALSVLLAPRRRRQRSYCFQCRRRYTTSYCRCRRGRQRQRYATSAIVMRSQLTAIFQVYSAIPHHTRGNWSLSTARACTRPYSPHVPRQSAILGELALETALLQRRMQCPMALLKHMSCSPLF